MPDIKLQVSNFDGFRIIVITNNNIIFNIIFKLGPTVFVVSYDKNIIIKFPRLGY